MALIPRRRPLNAVMLKKRREAARLKRRAPSADTLRNREARAEQRGHSNLVARTMEERAAYLRTRERAPWGLTL